VLVALAAIAAVACAPTKKGPPGPRVMLVGDSIGFDLGDPLAFAIGARGWAFHPAAFPGCGVVRGVFADFEGNPPPQAAFDCDAAIWGVHDAQVSEFGPSVVLWASIHEDLARYVDGGYYAPGHWPLPPPGIFGEDGDNKLLALIDEKRAQFTRSGARLVFVTMPPPVITTFEHHERVAHLNDLLKRFVISHPGDTALIDLAALACPPAGLPPCPAGVGGIQLRGPDGVHFTPAGASWAAQQIAARL
jgi:hypothetical protein